MNKPECIAKIHPKLIAKESGKIDDAPTFYEGEYYKVIGPISERLQTLGVLVAKTDELLEQLNEISQKVQNVIASQSNLEILEFVVSRTQSESPQGVVTLPKKEYVSMKEMAESNPQAADLVDKILQHEHDRGIYNENIESSDFWIDPKTKKLYFVALDKLKEIK